MFKYLLLLFIPFILQAQTPESPIEVDKSLIPQYVSLEENNVYDVEIIVFAYTNQLPNIQTYTNKAIFDDSTALDLATKPDDLNFVNIVTNDEPDLSSDDPDTKAGQRNYTVPMTIEKDDQLALTWFNHIEDDFKFTAIWEKLLKQSNIIPLVHRSWRQVETPYTDPVFVKIINSFDDENQIDNSKSIVNENQIKESTSIVEVNQSNDFFVATDEGQLTDSFIMPDYTLSGMVALSKGRYTHFENKLNLYRVAIDEDGNILKNMVFSLNEKKQIKADELNYFDSPWIGSIVKITEFKGEVDLKEVIEDE